MNGEVLNRETDKRLTAHHGKCPKCGSSRLWKANISRAYNKKGELVYEKQLYLCADCGKRTAHPIVESEVK